MASATPGVVLIAAVFAACQAEPQARAPDALPRDAEVLLDAARPPVVDAAEPAADVGVADAAPRAPDAGPEDAGGLDAEPVDGGASAGVAGVVIMGDSWSSGFVPATQEAFLAHGIAATLSFEDTARAGSRAAGWRANEHPPAVGGGRDTSAPRMLDALDAALDAAPPAEVLLIVLGGNDFLHEVRSGLGDRPELLQARAFDAIEADLQWLVDHAQAGRPGLEIVIVGYDFLHFELMETYAELPGMDRVKFNEALVELERRRRAIAARTPGVHFAHNLGHLQHTFGDRPHPPFPVPLMDYPPGALPAPGWSPDYDPFPGGSVLFPAPLDQMPDGLHPSHEGFRSLMDHVLEQGLEALLSGGRWP